jgi:hypothetical protein
MRPTPDQPTLHELGAAMERGSLDLALLLTEIDQHSDDENWGAYLRDALICCTDEDSPNDELHQLLLRLMRSPHPHANDAITELCLKLSLCPLHLVDYAICFDDDDDRCAPIRLIHPSHDT